MIKILTKKIIENPVLTLALQLVLSMNTAYAQTPAPTAAPAPDAGSTGPVDIQANEQEFSGDEILAKGNVHVKYKDTTIIGPQVLLSRKDGGSPQTAVFTGHPHLIQVGSAIDAETLTFDIANHKILAEGRSHSEVISSGGDSSTGPVTKDKNGKPIPAKPPTPTEKIITDADRQEYDQESDKFEAVGHVHVIHGDIKVDSDKLQLVYGPDKKPETAIFNGNVLALQGKNNTRADHMTYSLTTRRLQANGHVKSKVIQEKAEEPTTNKTTAIATAPSVTGDAAYAATSSNNANSTSKDEDIIIVSDAQDFTKENGRMTAQGNVKVFYQDSIGSGPETVLIRGEDGKPQKLIFIGRSQVMQPGKKWMADNITLLVPSKKVLAFGNTKSFIVQNSNQPATGNSKLATRPSSFDKTDF